MNESNFYEFETICVLINWMATSLFIPYSDDVVFLGDGTGITRIAYATLLIWPSYLVVSALLIVKSEWFAHSILPILFLKIEIVDFFLMQTYVK